MSNKTSHTNITIDGVIYVMPDAIRYLIDSLQILNNVLIDENDKLKVENEEQKRLIAALEQRIDPLTQNNRSLKIGLVQASKLIHKTPELLASGMKTQRTLSAMVSRNGRTKNSNKVKSKALDLYDLHRAQWTSDKQTAEKIFPEVFKYAQGLTPQQSPSKDRFYGTLLEWLKERKKITPTS